jgi:signal peptidase I
MTPLYYRPLLPAGVIVYHSTRNCGAPDFLRLATQILSRGTALRFKARGGSMYPSIEDGSLVEVEPVQASAVRTGDLVLCYGGKNRLIVHRVIDATTQADAVLLVTKGDSARLADRPVHAEDVLGRVVAIYKGGKRVQVGSGWGRLTGLLWAWLSPLMAHVYRLPRAARHVLRRIVGQVYTL